MTITTTIISNTVFGNKRIVFGSCANDSTGGDVVTGLSNIEFFVPVGLGSSAVEIGTNEAFPLTSGTVTVVTESSIAFTWMAVGY